MEFDITMQNMHAVCDIYVHIFEYDDTTCGVTKKIGSKWTEHIELLRLTCLFSSQCDCCQATNLKLDKHMHQNVHLHTSLHTHTRIARKHIQRKITFINAQRIIKWKECHQYISHLHASNFLLLFEEKMKEKLEIPNVVEDSRKSVKPIWYGVMKMRDRTVENTLNFRWFFFVFWTHHYSNSMFSDVVVSLRFNFLLISYLSKKNLCDCMYTRENLHRHARACTHAHTHTPTNLLLMRINW